MSLDIWSEFSIMKFYNESIRYEFSTTNMHQFYKSQNKDILKITFLVYNTHSH